MPDKGIALLGFLKAVSAIRRRPVPSYGPRDRVLWFTDVPRGRSECRSPFLAPEPDEFANYWLEARKTRPPIRPAAPRCVDEWVRPGDLDSPRAEPELRQEITVLVKSQFPEPEARPGDPGTVVDEVPERRLLADHPEVEDAWLEYLVNRWEPWAAEMRRWQETYHVYEVVDFMRRRLEESEEQFELFVGIGLLQWRDSSGRAIKRHLLTGPAELEFEAARGIIRVVPAASFQTFTPVLDMLQREDRPRLGEDLPQEQLAELDIQAWDRAKVGNVLSDIANRANPGAQVDTEALSPREHADESFRVTYAPALVLRERHSTGFDEMMGSLLHAAEDGTLAEASAPWDRFVAEGAPPLSQTDPDWPPAPEEPRASEEQHRLYFPLPTNREQQRIVDRLRVSPCVVVKGPPGTGKSHSIANLMSHLLAMGDRVLVTAQAPKALTVLRDMLPEDLRDLCVTALGSSRDDQELLAASVHGILKRENAWPGHPWAQTKIREGEEQLDDLEGRLARTERELRECREAETHRHQIGGGYAGTAAQLARRLEHERETLGWFPEWLRDQPPFPLRPEEVRLLAQVHSELTPTVQEELHLDTCERELPDTELFRQLVAMVRDAEQMAVELSSVANAEKLQCVGDHSPDELESTEASLGAVEAASIRAHPVLGELTETILEGTLAGQTERWARIARHATEALDRMAVPARCAANSRFQLAPGVAANRLLADAQRRLEHLRAGGGRGFLFLKPRVMKETRQVEERCLVDGRPPREVEQVGQLAAFLSLGLDIEDFARQWPGTFVPTGRDPRQALEDAKELVAEVDALLRVFDDLGEDCFSCIPASRRADLVGQSERESWLGAVRAAVAAHKVRAAQLRLTKSLAALQACVEGGNAHSCVPRLIGALQGRDCAAWQAAWEEREAVRAKQDRWRHYEQILGRLGVVCSSLVNAIRASQGRADWQDRLLNIAKAWAWASARGWVAERSSRERYEDLLRRSHLLTDRIERTTEEVTSLRAWGAFFGRLDTRTRQNLMGWSQAITQLGGGWGRNAYARRKEARDYLMECIPAIPAWIMPLHKLWETVNPEPGLFDTVIIDEASQAGIDSLALFLLAKRMIVVGDDKQNSPEAVGVREADIVALAEKYLREFHFRRRFRPDTSLFDHALRAFPSNRVSLCEHFRCVPEIIRFSNDRFYRDARLIPLRQPPPDRLPPLRSTFVDSGFCRGKGQRIQNPAEAEAVVQAILTCLEDDAYEAKSMGVIVLQGHAQADLIGSRLAAELDPEIVRERRLRCGVPSTFQGDQRDVIFLSMVISPEVHYQSWTTLAFQRRYNVAMSRAKDQVWLFHSVQLHDLGAKCLRRQLLSFFLNPPQAASEQFGEDPVRLEREARRPRRHPGEQPEPYDSWFEVDVALELLRRGYRIIPQYELAGKRIDLVVEGAGNRLAVECDGDVVHADQYDEDMARQRQLERAAKLTFVRVPEFEFYADRSRAVGDIVRACEELGIGPVGAALDKAEGEPPAAAGGEDLVHLPSPESAQLHVAPSHPDGAIEEIDELASERVVAEEGPFTGYSSGLGFPDPREAPSGNVRAALRRIVEKDGPLTRASTLRLYVEGCPHVSRAGRAVRQGLNRALGAMLRAGVIVQEDELGGGAADGLVLRMASTPRVRERPAGRRDLREIPPSELRVILARLRGNTAGDQEPDEALFRSLLDHYGFSRLTPVRQAYLSAVVDMRRLAVGWEKEAGPLFRIEQRDGDYGADDAEV